MRISQGRSGYCFPGRRGSSLNGRRPELQCPHSLSAPCSSVSGMELVLRVAGSVGHCPGAVQQISADGPSARFVTSRAGRSPRHPSKTRDEGMTTLVNTYADMSQKHRALSRRHSRGTNKASRRELRGTLSIPRLRPVRTVSDLPCRNYSSAQPQGQVIAEPVRVHVCRDRRCRIQTLPSRSSSLER